LNVEKAVKNAYLHGPAECQMFYVDQPTVSVAAQPAGVD
jgi:hypothetical protein